jgi:hypothetical protein
MSQANANAVWGALQQRREERAYAVLDAARDPAIVGLVRTAERSACLLAGELTAELAAAAPYLVELDRDFFDRTLARGWGESWGVFLASPASLEAVRRQLRRNLEVLGPEGERLFFRHYDPRVLRVYLPTCDAAELEQVFGPILRFVVEGEVPDQALVFSRAGAALGREVVAVSA